MSTDFLDNLSHAVSEERLAPYLVDASNGPLEPYARYFWNAALGESLYPSLQALEITLRNSLHETISANEGTDNWFEGVLCCQDIPAFEKIKERLDNQGASRNSGQIVANSDFGFWVRLLNSRYENILWPKLLRNAFPNMPNRSRTRKNLSRRLNRIRAMRNRVFHYEPVWNDPYLAQKHEEIGETIGWISPSMLEVVGLFDRFPHVIRLTHKHYEDLLMSHMG